VRTFARDHRHVAAAPKLATPGLARASAGMSNLGFGLESMPIMGDRSARLVPTVGGRLE
jgi:hypothetical protein